MSRAHIQARRNDWRVRRTLKRPSSPYFVSAFNRPAVISLKAVALTPQADGFGPNTLVDRVKVDQEGEFRLAPLKRVGTKTQQETAARHNQTVKERGPKVYYSDLDPIALYPAEFYAAQKVDAEMEAEKIHCSEVYGIVANDSKGGQTGQGTIYVPPD